MPYEFINKNKDIGADWDKLPKVPKNLLEHLKEKFDIRRSIAYEQSLEYLKGVQDVLDYLDYLHLYKEE